MKTVFADTSYRVALIFPRDANHSTALALSKQMAAERNHVVTSQVVLTEFLNFFSPFGPHWRDTAVNFVRHILQDLNTTVVEQTGTLILDALELYIQRRDKEWGHTDCASFLIMSRYGITEA
jgi:hypothetical protein